MHIHTELLKTQFKKIAFSQEIVKNNIEYTRNETLNHVIRKKYIKHK